MNAISELWSFIIAWYNLPFTLALLAFLGLSGLQFLGLGQDHEFDADAGPDIDLDSDLDLDVDADADLDADLHVDHDLEADHGTDLAHDADGLPVWLAALHFLGVGSVPLTIVLLIFLGLFGFIGWLINSFVVANDSIDPSRTFIPVFVAALAVSVLVTSRTSRVVGRIVPSISTTATSNQELVGRRGYVTSPQVGERYGQVNVRDKGGALITVFAVIDPGEPPIKRDQKVFLVEYDQQRRMFVVVPADM